MGKQAKLWSFERLVPEEEDVKAAQKAWDGFSRGESMVEYGQTAIFMAGFYRGMSWANYAQSLGRYSQAELLEELMRRAKEMDELITRLNAELEAICEH